MMANFDIPPAEHRGWPGVAELRVGRTGRTTAVFIDPLAPSGGLNGGHNYRYRLDLTAWQLLKLAVLMTVARWLS